MSQKSTVLEDYEPWPVVEYEDQRRRTMTAEDYAVAQFLDSLSDADAAITDPDVAEARQNTFIN